MFGSDYRALVLHYLNNGLAEGRLGYKVGANHGYGRWTVRSGNHIVPGFWKLAKIAPSLKLKTHVK